MDITNMDATNMDITSMDVTNMHMFHSWCLVRLCSKATRYYVTYSEWQGPANGNSPPLWVTGCE